MDKEKRLIYTSLGCYTRGSIQKTQSRKKKTKNSKNHSNHLMDTAARAYLKNPKLLPRN